MASIGLQVDKRNHESPTRLNINMSEATVPGGKAGVFVNDPVGKPMPLTTQRKIPLPKLIFRKAAPAEPGTMLRRTGYGSADFSQGGLCANPTAAAENPAGDGGTWPCQHCSYSNLDLENPMCAMCGHHAESAPDGVHSARSNNAVHSSVDQQSLAVNCSVTDLLSDDGPMLPVSPPPAATSTKLRSSHVESSPVVQDNPFGNYSVEDSKSNNNRIEDSPSPFDNPFEDKLTVSQRGFAENPFEDKSAVAPQQQIGISPVTQQSSTSRPSEYQEQSSPLYQDRLSTSLWDNTASDVCMDNGLGSSTARSQNDLAVTPDRPTTTMDHESMFHSFLRHTTRAPTSPVYESNLKSSSFSTDSSVDEPVMGGTKSATTGFTSATPRHPKDSFLNEEEDPIPSTTTTSSGNNYHSPFTRSQKSARPALPTWVDGDLTTAGFGSSNNQVESKRGSSCSLQSGQTSVDTTITCTAPPSPFSTATSNGDGSSSTAVMPAGGTAESKIQSPRQKFKWARWCLMILILLVLAIGGLVAWYFLSDDPPFSLQQLGLNRTR